MRKCRAAAGGVASASSLLDDGQSEPRSATSLVKILSPVRTGPGNAALIAVVLSLLTRLSLQARANAVDNLDEIKGFLLNRPVVRSVLFRRDNSGATNLIKELHSLGLSGKGPAQPEPYVTYHSAWDHGNFFFRKVEGSFQESFTLGTNISFFVGRAGNTLWEADRSHAAKSILSDGSAPEALDAAFKNETTNKNPVAISARIGDIQLSSILNFGLFDIRNETLRFSGNKFQVSLRSGGTAEGDFSVKQGRVTTARFQIERSDKYSLINYEYSSDADVPPFFPTRVRQDIYGKDGKLLRVGVQFEILHLKLASESLPESFFLPDQFYSRDAKRPTAQLFYTNTGFVEITRDGLKSVQAAPPITPMRGTRRLFILIFATAISLPVFLMFMRRVKSNTKNQAVHEL